MSVFARYRALLLNLLFLALFVAGIIGAFATTGFSLAADALEHIGAPQVLMLMALAMFHYVLRALRWHSLVRAAGVPSTLAQNFRHFFAGFAMTATPGRIGELVRLRWIRRETGWSFEAAAPIVLADRAIELAAIAFVIAVAVVQSQLDASLVWLLVAVSLAVAVIVTRPGFLVAFIEAIWRATGRMPRLFVRLRRAALGLEPFTSPRILFSTTLLGIVGWASEGFAFYLLLGWLGVPLDVWTATAIFLTAVLSGALSGLPGGLGSTEAAVVGLLLLSGVSAELALLATAVMRVTTLWFAVLLGVCVFPFAEIMSRRAMSGKMDMKPARAPH